MELSYCFNGAVFQNGLLGNELFLFYPATISGVLPRGCTWVCCMHSVAVVVPSLSKKSHAELAYGPLYTFHCFCQSGTKKFDGAICTPFTLCGLGGCVGGGVGCTHTLRNLLATRVSGCD